MATRLVADFSGSPQNPLGSPFAKPTSGGISGDLQLDASHIVKPAAASTDSWMRDVVNSYTGNNQWCTWRVGAVGGEDFGGVLQMGANGDGYYVTGAAPIGNITLYEVTGGATFDQRASTAGQTVALNDDFYFEIMSGVLSLYRGLSTAGTLILTWTDTTPFTGGRPGMGAYDGTGGFSAFSAGDDAAGGVTAPGATLTATSSLIAGAASSDTAPGCTLTATSLFLPGGVGAYVPGDILLFGDDGHNESAFGGLQLFGGTIDGGSATANGVTMTASSSLIAGSANGGASAAAATLAATSSLVAGGATGGASAGGQTLTATDSLIAGSATGGAATAGVTLTATSSLVPGSAAGAAAANGATLTATSSLLVGAATVDATAAGVTLAAPASIIAGAATGDAAANAATFTATASLLPGSASGGGAGTASGVTLAATSSLVAGAAAGQQQPTVAGVTLVATASLVAGAASGAGSATAPGVVLALTSSLLSGQAAGGAVAAGATLPAGAALVPGTATGSSAADAPGVLFSVAASLLPGAANDGRSEPSTFWAYRVPGADRTYRVTASAGAWTYRVPASS